MTAAHAVAFGAALCPPVAQAAAQSGSTGTDLRGVTQNWDRTLSAEPGGACPAASARFTCVFNNAGARDNETGLVWGHPQASTMDWWTARTACANDTTGGRKGWRLPTVTELSSLLDPLNAYTLKLPPGHPFAYLSSYYGYWIATLDGIDQPMSAYYALAWVVRFQYSTVFEGTAGNVMRMRRENMGNVWCVRGGESPGGAY